MVRVISKLSEYGALGFVCLTLGACSQARPNLAQQGGEPDVSVIESALEDPVSDCQQEQVTCLGAATDPAAAAQCSDAFRQCLGGAADIGQQLAAALLQCRESAAECAVQGGVSGADACRTEYEACVSAATEGNQAPPAAGSGGSAGADAPNLPQLPGAGSGAPRFPTAGGLGLPARRLPFAGAGGIGGLPTLPGRGLPGFPSAGSISLPGAAGRGGLPGRPGAGSNACFEELRMCVEAANADLNQCATAARACVRGGPLGAAGAGGSP
jgi:hypothetical protein